jgi:hypothetical protein
MINGNATNNKASESDAVGVAFSFKKGIFKRDAFIIDEKAHQELIDSLKGAASFMRGITYQLKYTFPTKVIKASAKDAKLSLDGKTIEIERSFLAYLKNPDILDLEVELE